MSYPSKPDRGTGVRRAWPAAAVLALTLFGCTRPSSEKLLVLTGSSTVAPLADDLARRFEAENPGVRIDVQTGGSARGIVDASDGTADIGMVSRNLHADESQLIAFPIAIDGIGMIVHATNTIGNLTEEQIRAIFCGRLDRWAALGGSDRLITVVNKAEGRSTLEVFLEHFDLENSEIVPQVVIGDNEQGIKTVAADPGAIGYVSIGAAELAVRSGIGIRLVSVDGVAPSTAAVQSSSFPVCRTLNFVTASPPQGLIKRFIEFARSEASHDLVQQHFFVPVTHP